jgi:hypothetical protein
MSLFDSFRKKKGKTSKKETSGTNWDLAGKN